MPTQLIVVPMTPGTLLAQLLSNPSESLPWLSAIGVLRIAVMLSQIAVLLHAGGYIHGDSTIVCVSGRTDAV